MGFCIGNGGKGRALEGSWLPGFPMSLNNDLPSMWIQQYGPLLQSIVWHIFFGIQKTCPNTK